MDLFLFLSTLYRQVSEDSRISATHISLYLALTQQWNLAGCKNPFPIDRETVMKAAKINARFTYNKCMNNLQEYGYIKYLPSSNSFTQSIIFLKVM
jgi:hypothetical protein